MNEHNWTNEPWEEQNFYRTGGTRPKKSRRGLLAIVLVAVIFFGGIITTMGLLNIHPFGLGEEQPENAGVGFTEDATAPSADLTAIESAPPVGDGVNIQLNPSPKSVENIPQTGGLSLQRIYEKAIDSVVSISCQSRAGASSGTGVVLSQDGYLVTNCHVVEDAASVEVLFSNGQTCAASIVGTDPLSDLAVLYVSATGLTPAEFGDSSALRVGDAVVAIGDPLGVELRGTMTDGIVSAINRDIASGGRTMTLIQTNAALNSGNSGGPLLNCYGQVIGINTMKIGDNMSIAGVEGLGFAIPSTTVKEIVDQLIANGFVSGRPALGITGQDISSFDQLYYRLPQGVYITAVSEGSDAAAKGIHPGDILLQLNGQRITGTESLTSALYAYDAGDSVSLVLYRSGRQYNVDVKLEQSQPN